MGTIISPFVDDLISGSRSSLLEYRLVVDILTCLTIVSMLLHILHLSELRRQNLPPRYSDLLNIIVPPMIHATAQTSVIILQCIVRVPNAAPLVATFMWSLLAMLWSVVFVLFGGLLLFQSQRIRIQRFQVRRGRQAMWAHLEWRARHGRWADVIDKGEVTEDVQELRKRPAI